MKNNKTNKRVDYGLILQETHKSKLKNAWWDVLCDGTVEAIHVRDISPLWDKEGLCLQENFR